MGVPSAEHRTLGQKWDTDKIHGNRSGFYL